MWRQEVVRLAARLGGSLRMTDGDGHGDGDGQGVGASYNGLRRDAAGRAMVAGGAGAKGSS